MVNSISILGSTGSIGRQTLAAARALGIPVKAISGNSSISLLEEQARQFHPELVAVYDEDAARRLRIALADTNIKVAGGMTGLIDCAEGYGECVVTAVSGSVGLIPTLAAIDAGRRIALANKETLVCAGEIVMAQSEEKGAEIIPVDSEHSAIFQCLEAEGESRALKTIFLTCSGGPFFGLTRGEMESVTPESAVSHPNWSMGAKISVDSATLMNKGLELIEAMHLFAVKPGRIRVIIHRESIIHSMVEFHDGSLMAQMGVPDMELPIRYALSYPHRAERDMKVPDFTALGALTFAEPDLLSFPCLRLAMDCARRGGSFPAAMSAANEEAVSLFLHGKIGFNRIFELVSAATESCGTGSSPSLEEIMAADEAARRAVRESA